MLRRIYSFSENASMVLSGLILMGLVAIGAVDVIAPMLGYPIAFVTELSQVCLAACIFLALPKVQSSMSNITIDIMTDRMSSSRRDLVLRTQYFFVALALAGLGYVLTGSALSSFSEGEYTPGGAKILLWPFKACAAFGVCLAGVGALSIVFRGRQAEV